MATSDINDLYKSTLGRSAGKEGLDYYTKMADEKGMDWVKNSIAGSDEASKYKASRGASKSASTGIASTAGRAAGSTAGTGTQGASKAAAVSKSINDLYQQNLGRSVDKAGLDYWTDIASKQGMDAVTSNISASNEAGMYRQRGTGLNVSALDQVSGFDYRNTADLASQQANSSADYGLLKRGMGDMADSGNFTVERDEAGNTLYRSNTGGLYDIAGAPVQERPTDIPQSTVTPDQTSRGQLDQMLASDSPLMQRAATQGAQRANQRGLLNSSMASEAAQGAMIDRATPFAQQDAQTYFQNSQANTDRQQQSFMAEQQYGFSSQLSSQEASQALDKLRATSTANGWGVMANNLTDIVGQYSSQLERIQMNPDIEQADKTAMMQQVLEMRDIDIGFQQSLYNELPNYLANTGVFPNR